MKPRHAELIASDLDEATVVKLVDRFLMFYVRTADRLQRTSTWRENLEGGLDYLKQVVVEDKLGIAAELEADMQRVVDTYADEWKNAVEDPAVRQRFRSFVNTESTDDNVVFMPERGQIRPATPEERRRIGAALADSGLLYEAIDDLMAANYESCYGAFSLLFLVAKAGVVEPLIGVIEKHPSLDLSLAVIRFACWPRAANRRWPLPCKNSPTTTHSVPK